MIKNFTVKFHKYNRKIINLSNNILIGGGKVTVPETYSKNDTIYSDSSLLKTYLQSHTTESGISKIDICMMQNILVIPKDKFIDAKSRADGLSKFGESNLEHLRVYFGETITVTGRPVDVGASFDTKPSHLMGVTERIHDDRFKHFVRSIDNQYVILDELDYVLCLGGIIIAPHDNNDVVAITEIIKNKYPEKKESIIIVPRNVLLFDPNIMLKMNIGGKIGYGNKFMTGDFDDNIELGMIDKRLANSIGEINANYILFDLGTNDFEKIKITAQSLLEYFSTHPLRIGSGESMKDDQYI